MLPGYGAKPQLTWQSLPSLSKNFNEEERKRISKIIGGPEATDIDGQVLIHEDSTLFPPGNGNFSNSGGGFF